MKILIAEDDAFSRRMITAYLEKWDFDYIEAIDGQQAVDAFNEHDDIQLAILDWMMPNLDGLGVVNKIKETSPNRFTYIIMLTAKSSKDDIVRALDCGADEFVQKPFDKNELKARINAGIRIINLESQLQDKISALNKSIEHIKQLQGIIPICAWCKKIRDDSDFWTSVESYISTHSDMKFSHSICPDCLEEHYPDDDDDDDGETTSNENKHEKSATS